MSDTRKAHVHAESMRLYAEDAADTDKPWKRWEGKNILHHSWFNCCQHPNWSKDFEYRRNPRTINIKDLESERDALRAEVAQLRAENQNLLSMIADGTPMQSDDYTRGEDSAKTCIAQLRVEGERLKAILENQGWLPLRPISWPENLTWEEGYAPVLPEDGIIYIQIKNERMQFQVLNGKKS